MFRRVTLSLVAVLLVSLIAARSPAADPPKLLTASGVVVKADKESLHVRGASDMKTAKARTFKLTGTSKLSLLVPQMRNGKLVLTQREIAADALTAGQAIALIYANVDGEGVVLTAVAQGTE